MANRIVQAIYDLKDNISAKLQSISNAWKGAGDAADKASSRAETSNKRLSDSFKQSADGVAKLREGLALLAGVVGFEKIGEGLKEIVDVGEEADDRIKKLATAFGGLDAGQKALDQIRTIAQGVPQSFDNVTDAAIGLKKAGIDPLDGSLQALLDNAAANNQSQEQLMKTIDDLGKTAVKGGVNLKALVALTEDGIPVFDLLGKQLGVSADRVRELANSGQLGSDSVKLLITSLGQLRAGAAADELGDFDSQMTKLKDSVKEFLETIASSGALQVFRDGIKNLNAEVEEAAKSGKLKELAQSVSDGIVSAAGAVKGAIGFVIDYAGALKQLAAAYLTVKAINISSSILSGASAMLTAGKAARDAAGQAEAASGVFGKLGSFIGGIPRLLKISVLAVGIDVVLAGLNKLISARLEQVKLDHDIRDAALANVDANNKLQVQLEQVKKAYKQYADVAIESNEQLKQQSAEQLVAYEQQLEGAKKFYNALAVQAAQAGDAVALKDANAHLETINAEIVKVNAQLAITQTVGTNVAQGLTKGAAEFVSKLTDLGTDAKAIGALVTKSFDDFDLKKQVTQVGDFAVALDTVAAKGGKTAEILDSTLLESLKKLSGEDLLQFQSNAIASIKDLGDKALASSEVLKATLEAGLERLGVKAQDTGQKITKTGADIIATFTAVAENSQATSKTITAAFDAAINSAKTIDELKALEAEIQTVASQGKVSFTDLASATRDFDERVRTVTASLDPLASQFEILGIKSQAQLNAMRDNAREAFDAIVIGAQHGQAAQEDVVRAFQAYVTASRSAAADSTQSAKDTLEEQLSVLASVNNLTDAYTQAGTAGKKSADDTTAAYDQAKQAIDDAANAAGNLSTAQSNAAANTTATGKAAQKSGQQIVQAMGGVIPVTEQASQALATMNDILSRQGTLANVSLDQAKRLLNDLGALAGAQAEVLQKRIEELEAAAEKAKEVAAQMADEAASLQDQIDELNGDDSAIEDRRHQKALDDLKAEAIANGQLGSAAYKHLLDLENQLHDLKLKHIQEQQAAQKSGDTATSSAANGASKPKSSPGIGGGGGTGSGSGGAGLGTSQPTINVNFHGTVIGGSKQDIATALAPQIVSALKQIQSQSRGPLF
jgi:tape measure domain-containing protein